MKLPSPTRVALIVTNDASAYHEAKARLGVPVTMRYESEDEARASAGNDSGVAVVVLPGGLCLAPSPEVCS